MRLCGDAPKPVPWMQKFDDEYLLVAIEGAGNARQAA